MAQFENFLEQKMKQKEPFEAYQKQAEKNLDYDDNYRYQLPYTADDMAEMFEDRIKGSTYEERVQYYFTDHNYMLAKAKRYLNLSENKQVTDEYARRYDNRSGKDRRTHAKDAAYYFGKAWQEEKKQEENRVKGALPRTCIELYNQREKIMNLRMEGMLCAAKAKSRGYVHGEYLQLRAKLSCYTILRDQALHLLGLTSLKDEDVIRQLRSKCEALDNKINSLKRSIASKLPTTKEQWQKAINLNDKARVFRNQASKQKTPISEESSKIAVCLNHCIKNMGTYRYPCTVPLSDDRGAPVTVNEMRKLRWNRDYEQAVKDKDQEKINRMNLEALKRFEEFKVPALADLQRKGSVPCFMENPGAFMEMVYFAAPYYEEKIAKNGWYQDYAKENPKFAAKVKLLAAINRNFRTELLARHHLIEGKTGYKAGISKNQEKFTDALLRGKLAAPYQAYTEAKTSENQNADSMIKQLSIDTERLDGSDDGEKLSVVEENLEEDNNIITTTSTTQKEPEPVNIEKEDLGEIRLDSGSEDGDENALKTDEIRNADQAALPSITYFNVNSKQDLTFVKTEPKNVNDAIRLRKYLQSKVVAGDLEKNPDVKALYKYYDLCVKQYLKTQKPAIDKKYLVKRPEEKLNLSTATYLRNRITENGLREEELPKEAKEIYDYYDQVIHKIREKEEQTEKVTAHQQRPAVSHKAFLNTNLNETYENQVKNSLDCWSCAGAGILNHYTRKINGVQPMTQAQYRAFTPQYRSPEDLGLDPKDEVDQEYYQKVKNDIDEFTIHNQDEDRVSNAVMGNPYMMSDLYLQELAKHPELKNTAVRKMEFHCMSAKAQMSQDPSVLHNLMQKFKDVVNGAIQKDSAVSLLLGKHYITITGIDGDQLEVCDSNKTGIIDNKTYKVSSLFNPDNFLFNLELVWFEQIDDPTELAANYKKLHYDQNNNSFSAEKQNLSENIALVNGVEAWKDLDEKDEDIKNFYAEGIYLPKTFTRNVPKRQYEEASKESILFQKKAENEIIDTSVKKTADKKKTTDKKATDKKETKQETKKKAAPIDSGLHMNEDHAAEFRELQKTNPNLTLDGYRYYRNFKISQEVWEDPKLNTLLTDQVKAVANIKETGFTKKKNAALSLAPSALLLDVRRKNDGTVPAEYRENVKWNEKWIKSWAIGKEEDRKKLVDEMLPQVIREVEIPNPVELRSGWIERQMDQNYVTFTGSIRRMLAMDHLMEEMPQAFKSLTPYLKTRLEAARQMAAYVKNYMLLNYGFSPLEGRDGCRMKAPLKAKQQRTLETQSNNLIKRAYQQAYNQYTEQEIAYLTMLKESGYIETKAKLQAVGKKLHKKRQEELRKTPEYLQMQAYEKEEYKREKEAYEREQSQKKAQRENDLKWANAKQEAPKASEAQIQKFFEIEKILDEVKKDKEKQGKDKKPQKEIALPTMEQIKNGWVDDMFQNHTRELIELLQNGSSEMDEKQALAYENLVNLIVVGISARHGVKFSTNGEKCTMGNPDHSKGMKSFIDKVLSKQYSEAYCELKGLDKKETWADFTAEKKKENKAAGKKDEKRADEKKKEDKKEINENKIIEKEDNSDSGDEFFEEEKKEQKKKTKEQVKIDLSRPLTKEEKEEFDRLNQGMKLSNERFVVFQAIKDSDAFMKYKCMTTTTNYMVKHTDICSKRDNLGLLGALSPLIQSIPKEETRVTSAVQHNEKWTKDFCGAKRNNAKCMESMNQMITKHFPKVFDGFVLPTPDELRAGWLPQNIKNNSFRLFEVLRKAAGVPKLVEESDTAREIYEKTPGFKQKAEAFLKLNEYAMKYIEVNYGIKRQNHREVPEFGEVRKGAALANANDDLDQFITQEYSKAYGALTNQQIEDMNGTKWDFSNCRDTELKLDDE
ncbi:MAG: phage tail tape measure protein [Lachnospiraceae bacterium]|nr:phage tail tape measure protein [Lachnospiraceae bacterium]